MKHIIILNYLQTNLNLYIYRNEHLGTLNVPFREVNKFLCLYNLAPNYDSNPRDFLSDVTEQHLPSARTLGGINRRGQ